MTLEEIVVDTNVFIVSLLDENILDTEAKEQRPLAQIYIVGLMSGRYQVHLPRIAIVEIVGVIRRRAGPGKASATKRMLDRWENSGLIRLYDLDEDRMRSATELVIAIGPGVNRSTIFCYEVGDRALTSSDGTTFYLDDLAVSQVDAGPESHGSDPHVKVTELIQT